MSSGNIEVNPTFCFPPGVCDLIFQHLTGNQLLVTSEASPAFYNFIAESKQCMKKIKIRLVKKTITNDDKQLLVESGRRYENIELEFFSSLVQPAIGIISAPERKWKRVAIRCIDFETVGDTVNFLSLVEPTVEELLMEQVYIKSMQRVDDRNLTFPNLKVLETRCCQALLFHEVFFDCKNLISFSMKSGSEISAKALAAIKHILQWNIGLKILGIHFNVFNLIFSKNLRFNLTEYHSNNLYQMPSYQSSVRNHLDSFLQHSQMNTIEILSISDWMGVDALRTIFFMPRLKDVTLKGFHRAVNYFTDWDSLDLHMNFSIVKMNFHDLSNDFQILKKVIKSTPSLTSLSLYSMDQTAMMFLSNNCKTLKSLSVERFLAEDISDPLIFPSLQELSFARKSEKLFHPSDKPLTHFESLVYKSSF